MRSKNWINVCAYVTVEEWLKLNNNNEIGENRKFIFLGWRNGRNGLLKCTWSYRMIRN